MIIFINGVLKSFINEGFLAPAFQVSILQVQIQISELVRMAIKKLHYNGKLYASVKI